MAYDGVVNEDNVYTCVGHPLKSDIRDIVTWMLNEPFSVAYNNIMNVKTLKGKSCFTKWCELCVAKTSISRAVNGYGARVAHFCVITKI